MSLSLPLIAAIFLLGSALIGAGVGIALDEVETMPRRRRAGGFATVAIGVLVLGALAWGLS